MSPEAVERNKDVVKRLFDAFRAGDTDAFDELIVEEYVQHNPQAGNGPAGGQRVLRAGRARRRGGAPGDRRRRPRRRPLALQDLEHGGRRHFHLDDDGKIIEHWDVLQQVPETTASGNDMFSQLS